MPVTSFEWMRLSDDLRLAVAEYLSSEDKFTLTCTAKSMEKLAATLILPLVVEANLATVAELIRRYPELIFQKGKVKDSLGQTYYEVSPYQLMTFLADSNMKHSILQLITPNMTQQMMDIRRAQYAEIDRGGADLVKFSDDPTTMQFSELLSHQVTYHVKSKQFNARFPGVQNRDAIGYYLNTALNIKHLFYINQETQSIVELIPTADNDRQRQALKQLYALFAKMEINSSKRSSINERLLIAELLRHPETDTPILLDQKGVEYETANGIRYRDNRYDFNRYYHDNRRCIRLVDEAFLEDGSENEELAKKAHHHWLELGKRQKETLWLPLLICQQGLLFDPGLDLTTIKHNRQCIIKDYSIDRGNTLLTEGATLEHLGTSITLHKGGAKIASGRSEIPTTLSSGEELGVDLAAVNAVINNALQAVAEPQLKTEDTPRNKPVLRELNPNMLFNTKKTLVNQLELKEKLSGGYGLG